MKRQPPRAWVPMAPAARVPLTDAQAAPLRAMPGGADLLAELDAAEMWRNDRYIVVVTRRADGSVEELSIRRRDRKAVHDWREFQRIKSEIAGPEAEGFELYPAESRLMDTANQYYLFVLPPGDHIPVGWVGGRNVADGPAARALGAVQRTLPEDWR